MSERETWKRYSLDEGQMVEDHLGAWGKHADQVDLLREIEELEIAENLEGWSFFCRLKERGRLRKERKRSRQDFDKWSERIRMLEEDNKRLRDAFAITKNMVDAQLLPDLVRERETDGLRTVNTMLKHLAAWITKVLDQPAREEGEVR